MQAAGSTKLNLIELRFDKEEPDPQSWLDAIQHLPLKVRRFIFPLECGFDFPPFFYTCTYSTPETKLAEYRFVWMSQEPLCYREKLILFM
jgi:hypothetical protein